MYIIKRRSYYSSGVKLLMNHIERLNANFPPVRLAPRIRERYISIGRGERGVRATCLSAGAARRTAQVHSCASIDRLSIWCIFRAFITLRGRFGTFASATARRDGKLEYGANARALLSAAIYAAISSRGGEAGRVCPRAARNIDAAASSIALHTRSYAP